LGVGADSWIYEQSLLLTIAASFCHQMKPMHCFLPHLVSSKVASAMAIQ